jgi:DNA-binding transcriptional ArsR family regulator
MATPVSFDSRRYLRHGMLPQLVAFDAVVRLGSVTRAGEALYMAQSTVSGHLRKLGEALGVRLFTMQGKQLVPTDGAQSLLTAAHEIFAALERCEHDLAKLRGDSRFGAPTSTPSILRMDTLGNADRVIVRPSGGHAGRARSQDKPDAVAPFR